jgi:HK97 family phage major capsid protein
MTTTQEVHSDFPPRNINEVLAQYAPVISALSAKERNFYSVARALRYMLGMDREVAFLERELSDAYGKSIGRPARGLYVPTRIAASGLDTKTGGAGGYTVGTNVPADIIELLRNKLLIAKLGAQFLTGLEGNVSISAQITGATTSWVGQNPGTDVAETNATFGAKNLSPKTLQGTSRISRQLLQQGSPDLEAFVRNDLATGTALAIDAAAIAGTGTQFQPIGLLNSGIGDVAIGGNGGAPTYDKIVELEDKIANANGDAGSLKILTTPTMRTKLRKVEELSGSGIPVWQRSAASDGSGDVIGYPGYVSSQVPKTLVKGSSTDCHAIILGDFTQVVIGEWGVIDVVLDQYTPKKQNMVEVTTFQNVDILVRQTACFAAIQDARNV